MLGFFMLLLLALGANRTALAATLAPVPPINAAARLAPSLNGRSQTIIDPYDAGDLNYRLQPYDAATEPTGGFFLDRNPANRTELLEYNFDRSPSLHVPGDWAQYLRH